eukprot:1378485-Rhodomonas_salina.3
MLLPAWAGKRVPPADRALRSVYDTAKLNAGSEVPGTKCRRSQLISPWTPQYLLRSYCEPASFYLLRQYSRDRIFTSSYLLRQYYRLHLPTLSSTKRGLMLLPEPALDRCGHDDCHGSLKYRIKGRPGHVTATFSPEVEVKEGKEGSGTVVLRLDGRDAVPQSVTPLKLAVTTHPRKHLSVFAGLQRVGRRGGREGDLCVCVAR